MSIRSLMVLLGVTACGASNGDARPARSADTAAATATAVATVGDTTVKAATDATVDFFAANELANAASAIARGPSTAKILLRRANLYYVEARRVANGVPEVHDDFSDVTVVQAGRATLHTGTVVHGSHVESPGEHRGGTIEGSARRTIATGDFFVIPAGVPHQYEIASGDSIRYLTVKVRRVR